MVKKSETTEKTEKNLEDSSKKPLNSDGHRARVREKILNLGTEIMQDYELLEALLMQAIPRKDVKPLAKEMIYLFGSLAGVFNASAEELQQIKGIKENTASLILLVKAFAVFLAKSELSKKEILKDEKSLLRYCKVSMGEEKIEMLRVFFLDSQNGLIKDEILQKGTIDRTPIYPKEIAKRALELGASSLILVHNHPSGNFTPSRLDIEITKKINVTLKHLDIVLHDHFIISKSGHSSFRMMGLL